MNLLLSYPYLSYYEEDYTYDEIKTKLDDDINFKVTNNNAENITIELTKDIEIITPGLNLFFDNPHTIIAKKVIKYE